MSAEATPERRGKLALLIIESLEEMNFDAHEVSSTLCCALLVLWEREKLPVELFEAMVAETARTIAALTNEPTRPS